MFYLPPSCKGALTSNLVAIPFLGQFLNLPALLSAFFSLLALGEIVHIIWHHWHQNPEWQ